jgi:DNA (cytosine-5)-methyltransferase 1
MPEHSLMLENDPMREQGKTPGEAVANDTNTLESFRTLRSGVSVRQVRLKTGAIFTTSMGAVDARRGESDADRADRAFLSQSVRPESGARRPLRAADIYSGCGGLSLGVAEACRAVGRAFVPIAAFDKDEDARAVYKTNFPTATTWKQSVRSAFDGRYGQRLTPSERKIKREIGEIDVLVAGPPCQGWSSLNNHTRGDDPKNQLYRRAARVAEVLEPRWLLIENVVAARDAHAPSGTMRHLEQLGYEISEAVVPLLSIGVAQRRRRHIVLAVDGKHVDLNEVLTAFTCPARPLRWAIGDLKGLKATREFDKPSRISKDNLKRMAWLRRYGKYNLPNERRPECHWGDHTYQSMYGRLSWKSAAQTITSGYSSMGQGRYVHPDGERTLTPHEAARIQFFPDWFDFGDRHRTAWATLIGNAVPMKLSYMIALWLLR